MIVLFSIETPFPMPSSARIFDDKIILFNYLVNTFVKEDMFTINYQERNTVRCAVDDIFRLHHIPGDPQNKEWQRRETLRILEEMNKSLDAIRAQKPETNS